MKRFYCTICKRVKRVRSLPTNITNESSLTPGKRTGECDRHFIIRTHPVSQPVMTVPQTVSITPSARKSKGKK